MKTKLFSHQANIERKGVLVGSKVAEWEFYRQEYLVINLTFIIVALPNRIFANPKLME